MATTNVLEAKITADISGLKAGLSKAEKLQGDYASKIKDTQRAIVDNLSITKDYEGAIKDLTSEYKKGNISQKEFQKQLNRVQRDEKETQIETENLRKKLVRLKKDSRSVGEGLGKSMGKAKKATANATPTVIEFSRVIQDAPYGIQGVANNIQQLTTNFTYLKKSAGGTIPALKSLASSFAGPAGIVFAVSTITSLLVTYGDELFKAGNSTKNLEEKVDSLNDSFDAELGLNKETERSLELQGKSVIGVLDARKDIIKSQISSLGLIIQQQSELLKKQKIENDSVSTWEAILLIFKDFYTVFISFTKNMLTFSGIVGKTLVSGVKSLSKSWVGGFIPGLEKADQILSVISKKIENKKKSGKVSIADQKKENELQNKLNELKTQELKLKNDLLEIDKQKVDKTPRKKATSIGGDLKPAEIDKSFLSKAKIEPLVVPAADTSALEASLSRALEVGKVFTNALGSAFGALGSQIAGALATGNAVVDAFVSSIVNSLASMLAEFVANQIAMKILSKFQIGVEQAKANAAGIVVATQAATALGPLGLAALPGLIAGTAGVINGSFAPLLAFANGGIVPGGSFNGDKVPAMVNSGEMILNGGQQSNLFKALNGNLSKMQGNSGSNGYIAETVVRGQDMYILMKRAEKSNKRFGN